MTVLNHVLQNGIEIHQFDKENKEYPAESFYRGIGSAGESDIKYDSDCDLSKLVGYGIEQLAQRTDLIESSRNLAVKEIAETGEREHRNTPEILPVHKQNRKGGHHQNS